MATLNQTLTLSSTDATSDKLSVTDTQPLTVTEPSVNIARAAVLHSATTTIVTPASGEVIYVYLKNLDTANFIVINFGGTATLQLPAKETTWFALSNQKALSLQADTATVKVEYAYWKKG